MKEKQQYDIAINDSIKEFLEIVEDVSTSDLQGIVDVRAMEITRTKLGSQEANKVAERILSGLSTYLTED
jgi:hypothetical protein